MPLKVHSREELVGKLTPASKIILIELNVLIPEILNLKSAISLTYTAFGVLWTKCISANPKILLTSGPEAVAIKVYSCLATPSL